MKNLKNSKGITLVALAVTIVVLTILTVSLTTSITSTIELRNYYATKEDILELTELVQKYYLDNDRLPIALGATPITYNSFATEDTAGHDKNPNDNDNYYEIDASQLSITLNKSNTYLVNEQSLTIYCKEGFILAGSTHYTASDDFSGGSFAEDYYSTVELPIIAVVTLKSNGSDNYHATTGDTVTLKILSNYDFSDFSTMPVVTLKLGDTALSPTTTTVDGKIETLIYTMGASQDDDGALLTFSVDVPAQSVSNSIPEEEEKITETTFGENVEYDYSI